MTTPTSRFLVSDGKLMLQLEVAEEGGYVVTSPFNPELLTEAETLEGAFEMAYDALECLEAARQIPRRRIEVLPQSRAGKKVRKR